MCQLAGVSRASYYRCLQERAPDEEETEVRAAIQQVVLKHRRRYGYRRVSVELRRQGLLVNHKRVLRLMRQDNLLALQRRKFVRTTESELGLVVYLNLAPRMELTDTNQLWVADITYIRLRREFVYLAVLLDAFSRRVVGWNLDRSLAARLPFAALRRAIRERRPPPGLVHHSDGGIQYTCSDYVAELESARMVPSLSRPATPWDNAACESFMKTLKQEEIYCHQYADLDELTAHVEEFLDVYYNHERLHSALGYRTPAEFEEAYQNRPEHSDVELPPAAKMSFPRHTEIFQSDGSDLQSSEGSLAEDPPSHRLDESPAGYSSASCSPAELASASPAEDHCEPETKKE